MAKLTLSQKSTINEALRQLSDWRSIAKDGDLAVTLKSSDGKVDADVSALFAGDIQRAFDILIKLVAEE